MATQDIPVFPLQMVAYPGEEVPLHIFEPRYRHMVAECERTGGCFGIVPVHDRRMAPVGCGMRLREVVNRYPDGRLDVLSVGDEPFHVERLRVEETEAFPHRADVVFHPVDRATDIIRKEQLLGLYVRFHELIGTEERQDIAYDAPVSFQIGHTAGLDVPQQIRLLELRTEDERIHFLLEHFVHVIPTLENIERTREKVRQNGHFRILPGADFNVNDWV